MSEIAGFFKQHGAERADTKLNRISDTNFTLFCSFGMDDLGGYRWRKDYDHRPTVVELRSDIETLINEQTRQHILTGFSYDDKPVWLSQENQLNFRAPVKLPVRFKLCEDADGNPVYHTFESRDELDGFNRAVAGHIVQCLEEGYREKDAVDYESILQQNN